MLTRNPNQFTVRLVQRSHGRNEHARLVFYLRLGPGNRGENFHATSIPYLPAMRESRSVSRSPECQIESCSGTPTSTKNQSPQSKRPIKRSTVVHFSRHDVCWVSDVLPPANEISAESFRNVLRNSSVLIRLPPSRSPIRAESCRSF